MNDFIEVGLSLYVIINFIIALAMLSESLHDNFNVFDIRLKHLIVLVLFPFGAIAGIAMSTFFAILDTLIYMVKKNERIQRVANIRLFKRKDDT